jgi:hypothetical protein
MMHAPSLETKWIAILRASLSDFDSKPAPDEDMPAILSAARGQHRNWIVACLKVLRAVRAGVDFPVGATHASPARFEPRNDGGTSGTATWHALPTIEFPAPAIHGAAAANAVWQAYLQHVLGDPAANGWLTRVIESLDPTALRAGIHDNPEPWWANELLILHALQSFVLISPETRSNARLSEKIAGCVTFHVAEIQPDHATNEPWAIHAFGRVSDAQLTAETLLHAALVNNGGNLSPVAQLIAADALHALEASVATVGANGSREGSSPS